VRYVIQGLDFMFFPDIDSLILCERCWLKKLRRCAFSTAPFFV
jgi:hypothetical protein